MIRVNILGHLKNLASLLSQPIPCPGSVKFFCQMEGFWIEKGDKETDVPPEYVLTASVKENLKDLARVVSGRLVLFLLPSCYKRILQDFNAKSEMFMN